VLLGPVKDRPQRLETASTPCPAVAADILTQLDSLAREVLARVLDGLVSASMASTLLRTTTLAAWSRESERSARLTSR